jgi:hypothetical protein
VVAGPAVLPEPVVITLEVPAVTPNVLAILMNPTPGVLMISSQVHMVTMHAFSIGREGPVVATLA